MPGFIYYADTDKGWCKIGFYSLTRKREVKEKEYRRQVRSFRIRYTVATNDVVGEENRVKNHLRLVDADFVMDAGRESFKMTAKQAFKLTATDAQERLARAEALFRAFPLAESGLPMFKVFKRVDVIANMPSPSKEDISFIQMHQAQMMRTGLLMRSDFWPDFPTFGQVVDLKLAMLKIPGLSAYSDVIHNGFSFGVRAGSDIDCDVIAFPQI